MIKLQIIGHLGKDATVNTVNSKQVINFTVAHTEKYKDSQGNQQEKTIWVDCAYWSDSKVGPYLLKGTQVFAEGTPEVRQFDRADGTKGASLAMRVFQVQLLGSKQPGQQPQTSEPAPAQQPAQTSTTLSDDLPF